MFLKPVIPVLEYVLFYDYIANVLCENKEKPALECNGKCYLTKEMAKASDAPENGNDEKQITIETSLVFFQEIDADFGLNPFLAIQKSKIPSTYNLSYSHLKTDSIFRPPIV